MTHKRTTHLRWMRNQESPDPGHTENWATWKSLRRLQTEVGRSKVNLKTMGILYPLSPLRERAGNITTISPSSLSLGMCHGCSGGGSPKGSWCCWAKTNWFTCLYNALHFTNCTSDLKESSYLPCKWWRDFELDSSVQVQRKTRRNQLRFTHSFGEREKEISLGAFWIKETTA